MADVLSRTPFEHRSSLNDCGVCSELPHRNPTEARGGQLKDPDLEKIIKSKWTNRGCIVVNGVLYRYSSDGEDEDTRMVAPSHERQRILEGITARRGAPTAAYCGVERTLQRIARKYYL